MSTSKCNARPAGYSDSDSDGSDFEISGAAFNTTNKTPFPFPKPISNSGYNKYSYSGWENDDQDQDEAWVHNCGRVNSLQKLELAISTKDVHLATELFNKNVVSINQYLDGGWTLLLTAARAAAAPLIDLFLKNGADVDQSTSDGYTSLMAAANQHKDTEGALESVQLLLSAGANVNACSGNGLTPLMFAAKEKNIDIFRVFLDAGASIDQQDRLGRTAMIWAAEVGFGRGVRLLIERNANSYLLTDDSMSAYDIALEKNRTQIAHMLNLVERTKWLPGLHPSLSHEKEYHRSGNQDPRKLDSKAVEWIQIDMILEKLGLEKYSKAFAAHELQYIDFIRLTEEHLLEIGVTDIKDRTVVLNYIREIFARDWPNASLLPINLRKDITAAESVCMTVSIGKHVRYMKSTAHWMLAKTLTNQTMLECGTETIDLPFLISCCDKVEAACDVFQERIDDLNKSLDFGLIRQTETLQSVNGNKK